MIGRDDVGMTSGFPPALFPALMLGSSTMLLGDCAVFGKTIGASRMVNVPRPKVVANRLLGSPGWATGRPVVGSTAPRARVRSETWTLGRTPPSTGAASKAMLGKSAQVWPL